MGVLAESRAALKALAARYPAGVIVGFSGGKDSWAVLDLCVRVFPRVEPYFWYLVPGLECEERELRRAERRYGLTVRRLLHPYVPGYFQSALFMPDLGGRERLRLCDQADSEAVLRRRTGLDLVALGWRKCDSIERAIVLNQTGPHDAKARRCFPIASWTERDVYAYLRAAGIPAPYQFGERRNTGVALKPRPLAALKKHYPDDYAKILRVFPHAGVLVHRAEFRHERNTAAQPAREVDAGRAAPQLADGAPAQLPQDQ